jgi:hypothetical protein
MRTKTSNQIGLAPVGLGVFFAVEPLIHKETKMKTGLIYRRLYGKAILSGMTVMAMMPIVSPALTRR